jgi:uncharacterized cupin superfamily protein
MTIITRKESLTPKHKAGSPPFEYLKYEVTERGQGHQCYVCLYELPPGKAGYPYHYHAANTEVFYIISGNGEVITPEGARPVTAGDVIVCPPDKTGAHKLVNTSMTELLCYLDCATTNSPDVCYYPDSNKVGVIVKGQGSAFFDEGAAVDYYKGE